MTYSIVARDPDTGELGVAVQSHWFSVGSVVTWARPGVGAVATQANADPGYGPQLLDLLAAGVHAEQALATLVANDPAGDTRQVAVVDAAGHVAAHTGSSCMPYAGHVTGAGVSCQANIMATERVWPAMLEAYRRGRRLAHHSAARRARRGRARGRRSARPPVRGDPRRRARRRAVGDRRSLRVEDHPEPLPELRRLVALNDAYTLAGQADELAGLRPPRRGRAPVRGGERARPGQPRAAVLGRARAPPRPATLTPASRRCGRRSRCSPRGGSCWAGCRPRSRRRRPPCSRAWPATSRAGGPAPPARGPAARASRRARRRASGATRFAPA